MNKFRAIIQLIWLPVMILMLCVGIIMLLNLIKPREEKIAPVAVKPAVQVTTASRDSARLKVLSQGEVRPLTEIDLTAQVSGKIVKVSDAFRAGGVFEEGDLLLEVERSDYELALIGAEANLARAVQALKFEQAEADLARQEWQELNGDSGRGPSALTLREPQLAQARANYQAALAEVKSGELNLSRTRITAPFNGRVRKQMADIGQFVGAGSPIGQIFSTDKAEIRLALSDEDMSRLDMREAFAATQALKDGPDVVLSANLAGRRHSWNGKVVRTDASIDPTTRQISVIAEVDEPYGAAALATGVPLAVGLFVEAEIDGREVEDAVVIPRSALQGDSGNQVYTVDSDNILRIVKVDLLAVTADQAFVSNGIKEGDVVVIGRIREAVVGEEVSPFDPTVEERDAVTGSATAARTGLRETAQ